MEFIHKDKKSIVSQREVGKDTGSFAKALKSALRQDPDIILVGEMRDLETISLALTAAETGHLVFGTLHASSPLFFSSANSFLELFTPENDPNLVIIDFAILIAIYGANQEEAEELYELAWELSQNRGPNKGYYPTLVQEAFDNSRTILEQAVANEGYEWKDGDRILDSTIILEKFTKIGRAHV